MISIRRMFENKHAFCSSIHHVRSSSFNATGKGIGLTVRGTMGEFITRGGGKASDFIFVP